MTSLSSSSAASSGGASGLRRSTARTRAIEHLGTEGLGHVIVGAEIQAADDVGLLALGGQHDDGHGLGPRLAPQTLADGQPVEVGQHEVQEDQVGRLRGGGGQRLFARAHARHLVAFLQQVVADQFADVLLILDHQHGFFQHVSTTHRWLGQGTGRQHNGGSRGFLSPYVNQPMLARVLASC